MVEVGFESRTSPVLFSIIGNHAPLKVSVSKNLKKNEIKFSTVTGNAFSIHHMKL